MHEMTSPENRFRIPGGSLDLDFDDDHTNGTAQVGQTSISSLPELPPQIQSILYLAPTDLSRVLSWIPHPLAVRTAEYVLVLNISGNAFRNLDLSALTVLADHDPAMAEELVRIQGGILPSPPPPAAPSHNCTLQTDDGALLPSGDDRASFPSDPSPTSHSTLSGSIKPCPCDLPSNRPLTPPSSSTSPRPVPPAPQTSTAPPSNEEEAAETIHRRSDLQSSPNEAPPLPEATPSEMQTLGRSSAPSPSSLHAASAHSLSPCTTIPPSNTSADASSSEAQKSVLTDGGSPEDSTSPKDCTDATTDCNALDVDGDRAKDVSGSGCATAVTSEAFTPLDSLAKSPEATDALADSAEGSILSVQARGDNSETQALPRGQNGTTRDPAGGGDVPHGRPTAPIHASKNKDVSPPSSERSFADSCTRNSDSAPVSTEVSLNPSTVSLAWTTSPQPNPDTPASCASTSCSVLRTPPASSTSPPNHMNNTSFLDLDLLQFSPFSVRAQLSHDAQMSSAELFKENAAACLVGTDFLMADGPCEEQFEHASDESSESVQQQDPNLGSVAHGFTPTPFSSTAEFHGAAAALGDQGTSLSLDNDSYLGDGTPASNDEGSFATEFGLNQPTGSRPDSYFCPQLGKNVEDRSGACDDDILAPVASPNLSSVIRPHGGSSIDCHANAPKNPHADAAEPYIVDGNNKDSNTKVAGETHRPPNGRELRSQLLPLSIPISPTSLEEELSQLSPLFSPIARNIRRTSSENIESPAFEQLFSERSFSAFRTPAKRPVKLKRRGRMQTVAHESRGIDTSDSGFTSRETKVFVDASVQTDTNVEEENLQRRVKALERELRSLRAAVRRSDERGRESKPRSFWKKVATTDRVVPLPEPMRFGLLNFSSFGQESFSTNTGS
ncbi:hypothetical protein C8R44DRAFT_18265 [Mycena epipterygia]|nr:hypothetical protein C8R44DRAFT_18265 [Mycena epipterygia]